MIDDWEGKFLFALGIVLGTGLGFLIFSFGNRQEVQNRNNWLQNTLFIKISKY